MVSAGSKMSAPSASGLLVELLLRVIDVKCGRVALNLRSGPFLASPICSLMSSLAKIGPDQKSLKNSGRSAKFWPTKLVI